MLAGWTSRIYIYHLKITRARVASEVWYPWKNPPIFNLTTCVAWATRTSVHCLSGFKFFPCNDAFSWKTRRNNKQKPQGVVFRLCVCVWPIVLVKVQETWSFFRCQEITKNKSQVSVDVHQIKKNIEKKNKKNATHLCSAPLGGVTSWWFQPLWKIWVKWESSPSFGAKTKNIWVATT